MAGERAVVRGMVPSDFPTVKEIWTATGIPEGLYAIEAWHKVDPEAFVVATVDGEVVGSYAGVSLTDTMGFVGLYAVRADLRGQGIGMKMWWHDVERLRQGRNVGLNAVPERLADYRDRGGFPVVAPWHVVLFSGTGVRPEKLKAAAISGASLVQVTTTASTNLLDELAAFDAGVHGHDRKRILRASLHEDESLAVAALKGGKILGYGVIKKGMQGKALIGPCYARNPDVAEWILKELLDKFPPAKEKGLDMYLLDSNPPSIALAQRIGLQQKAVLPKCHTKEIMNPGDHGTVFAIHTINFSPF